MHVLCLEQDGYILPVIAILVQAQLKGSDYSIVMKYVGDATAAKQVYNSSFAMFAYLFQACRMAQTVASCGAKSLIFLLAASHPL